MSNTVTQSWQFGAVESGDNLFSVTHGVKVGESLRLAADLATGIEQICERLHDDINMGAMAYCAEIRTIGFLGQALSAVMRSIELAEGEK